MWKVFQRFVQPVSAGTEVEKKATRVASRGQPRSALTFTQAGGHKEENRKVINNKIIMIIAIIEHGSDVTFNHP